VLSWIQAGAWNDIGCDDPAMTCTEWTETSADVSDHAFALIVRGDSMFNPSDKRSLADGVMVVVDSVFNLDVESLNHKIVVAMLEGTNEATIKEFVKDGPNMYLNPLNPRYPIIPIDGNCRIVAVAKEGKIKL
jgi:SOS-response transcriptional repressor LexA